MTTLTIGSGLFGTKPWGGYGYSPTPTTSQVILFITTGITLNWTDVDEASSYQLQVSMFADFRTTFVNDSAVSASFYSFVDGQTNDLRRYWRVRPHNGTEYFEPWSEIGSYWVDTTATEELSLDRNQWSFADIDDTTDQYLFDMFPTYTIVPQNLNLIQERNRLGELLSEFLTIKNQIQLFFNGSQYLDHRQFNEIRRFHNVKRTFYLYAFIDGEWHRPMPHIWKVEFVEDPILTMLTAGRPDLLTGAINLQEV